MKYWISKDGSLRAIDKMDSNHLANAIALIHKNFPFVIDMMIRQGHEIHQAVLEYTIEDLIEIRKNNEINKIFPVYSSLISELEKRGKPIQGNDPKIDKIFGG